MPTNVHSRLPEEEIHIPFRRVFADLSEKANDDDPSIYTEDDINKLAIVETTKEVFVLTSIDPVTWSPISAAGGGGSSSVKYAKFIFDTAGTDIIMGDVTTDTEFSNRFTIPEGIISEGDLFSISLIFSVNCPPASGPSTDLSVGLSIGGQLGVNLTTSNPYLAEITLADSDSDTYTYAVGGGTMGGFSNVGSSSELFMIGQLNPGGDYLALSHSTALTNSIDTTADFDVVMVAKWDGARSDAVVRCIGIQLQIISAT
jgi:hypothetical protein